MLPIELSFEGFESYRKAQKIDFSRFADKGIFLICGETGSGKTAVLDAMTYALFGVTSGGDRQQVRNVSAEGETVTEFIFDANGKRYKFRRGMSPKKRSKDKLDMFAECYVYSDEKSGYIPLIERFTATNVTKAAENVIGLNAEEFRRMTVLPQGKFEAFLTCDSSQKEEILTKIFGDRIYRDVADKLVERSNEALAEVRDARTEMKAILDSENCGSADELDGLLAEASAAADRLEREFSEAEKAAAEAQKKFDAQSRLSEKYSEYDKAKAEFSGLDAQKETIENDRRRAELHAKAAAVMPFAAAYENAVRAAEERRNDRLKAKSECDDAEKSEADANADAEHLPEIERRLAECIAMSERTEKLRASAEKYKDNRKRLSAAENERKKLEDELEKYSAVLAGFTEKCDDISHCISEMQTEINEKLPVISAELKKAEEAERLADEISRRQDISISDGKKAAEMTETSALYADEERKSLDILERARADFYSEMAYRLAELLEDNAPCPVCGSVHHPSSAEKPEHSISREELERLQKKYDERSARYAKITAELSSLNRRITEENSEISELMKKYSGYGYSAEKANDLRKENVRLSENVQRIAELNDEKNVLAKRIENGRNICAEHEEKLAKAKSDVLSLTAVSEMLESELCGMSDDDIIRSAEKLRRERSELDSEKSRITAEKQAARTRSAAAKANYEHCEKECLASENAFAAADTDLKNAAAENGFADMSEAKAALIPAAELSEITAAAAEFARRSAVITEKISSLDIALNGTVRPDEGEIFRMKEELSEKKAAYSETVKNKTAADITLKRLCGVRRKYSEKAGEFGEKAESAERLHEFAELMRGSRGMSFNRYAMGVMLALIADEANRIMADCMGGKFRLSVISDGVSEKSKSGLDLNVETAEGIYPVQNLSGGEKFLISLALSQALSSVARMRSGGAGTEAMFVDEGFGSLDGNSLVNSVKILRDISGGKRLIGIISHVEAMREIISGKITVTKTPEGSHIAFTA